ncbi:MULTISPECIES: class I poly(R)-hydroxyalkanoic acid synthase [unclassified Roseitalea]|uniref:PHA/PHB synthase family protein n=1 Tax=unclassified Roseitalea TaxID=2639107 RepID=UPI00273DE6C1|nr:MULTISPECIES: class I poly(R)-hydroxyalkanoic acid synthase [unclassified Roseitalea]
MSAKAKDPDQTGAHDGQADALDAYVIKDPEAFARNLARMIEAAGHAAANWVAPRERGETHDTISEPAAEMAKTFSKVTEYWLSDPQRAIEAQTRLFSGYMNIWANSIKRMGDPSIAEAVSTDPRDKRFADEDWKDNAFFSFLKQAYLVTSNWASELVDEAEGLDPHTKHKAQFYMRQFTSALSPSNFMVSNPEIFKETVATNGANLVRGMEMLADDIKSGKGEVRLRQADYSKFEIGKNLATTPGKVIARSDLVEVIQYAPTTDTVLKRPLLICPPWINKFYILDLNPDKSFIRWAVGQGHTVFVMSWVNPDERHATMDWNAYVEDGLFFALDAVRQATGETRVNAIGYCVGGTLLAAALALMARNGDERIATATLFTTQVDFTHAGDLKVFVDDEQLEALEARMKRSGYLDGSKMATAFNMLRAGDLIWPYVVNNYMKGKDPLPFDLLYWNADSTRMAAANHIFYLRNCYHENNLARGMMRLSGKRINLGDVTVPVYNLATREDHIAPALSVFEGSKLFGGAVTYVLGGSGHIAGVVNPPHRNKYQFWSGPKVEGTFAEWLEKAEMTQGSWWPHWDGWIREHDDAEVKARKPGIGRKKPLADAPGDYVRVRV